MRKKSDFHANTRRKKSNLHEVVSPQGLIALKSIRSSGQDRDDIDYLRSIAGED